MPVVVMVVPSVSARSRHYDDLRRRCTRHDAPHGAMRVFHHHHRSRAGHDNSAMRARLIDRRTDHGSNRPADHGTFRPTITMVPTDDGTGGRADHCVTHDAGVIRLGESRRNTREKNQKRQCGDFHDAR